MTTTFENNLLGLAEFLAMLPVQAVAALCCLLWSLCRAIYGLGWCGVYTAAVGALLGVCICCPVFALGLALIAVFGFVTFPRKAVRYA